MIQPYSIQFSLSTMIENNLYLELVEVKAYFLK